MTPRSRHASPVFVRGDGSHRVLERFGLDGGGGGDSQRREQFIQDLVHDHPTLIPMADIEPAFTPLISICKELPTAAGTLDNLWLTPEGGIVLGECKLFRNPQARREVIAQALDYAAAIGAWAYQDLEEAVRKALRSDDVNLWAMLSEHSTLSEAEFVDAVERRLRASRFMILIIGDGIQEGLEALTRSLQLHPGIHAAVALIDLSIWRGADGGILIVPRIPLKTVLVERGIVVIDQSGSARVQAPRATPSKGAQSMQAITLSEEEFYAQLDKSRPRLSERLRTLLGEIEFLGVIPEFQKSLVLRWYPSPGVQASVGSVTTSGKVWLGDARYFAEKLGNATAGDTYLTAVANAIGGVVQKYDRTSAAPQVKDQYGHLPDLAVLLDAAATWKAAIERLIAELASAED